MCYPPRLSQWRIRLKCIVKKRCKTLVFILARTDNVQNVRIRFRDL